jgi:transposase
MIDDMIERQAALIAALDTGDADAILAATEGLAWVVEAFRTRPTSVDPNRLGYALKQAHAASIRVNYLSHWTRQKIDRLAEHRGQRPGLTYAKLQKRGRIEA